jgi:hypothetical protein
MPTYTVLIEVESPLSTSQLATLYSFNVPGLKTLNLEVKRTSPPTTAELIEEQQSWIDTHGGSEAGYISRYGSRMDDDYYGEGGEAIYAADTAELSRLQELL